MVTKKCSHTLQSEQFNNSSCRAGERKKRLKYKRVGHNKEITRLSHFFSLKISVCALKIQGIYLT